ncbi:MAG: SRPBCC domain-containing protein [Alphaproteobacteria bacterium]|nr:SRPBCC domain-containing protein [Alphaproteobacteria bacterium]MBL7099274.1 SRPBCC domain-containing protein [Alphaproteobacteria bacterium]
MTTLTLVRRIRARPAIVFEALITAEGIAQWWGPDDGPVLIAEVDGWRGGRFRIRFRIADGSEHECYGEFLEVAPPERVRMSWRWVGGVEDPGESVLAITLRATGEGTELTLTHALLADDASRESHEAGWSGALDKLVAMFAGDAP